MAKSKMSVLKRQRELKKAERAAVKRQRKLEHKRDPEVRVATREDLEGYGVPADPLGPLAPAPRRRESN
jgi:hypothetical protein